MRFTATLVRYPGVGGWTFAPLPPEHAPPVTAAWGRTAVRAVVDGHAWQTSVWRDKSGRTLLPVPKKIRGAKEHGDQVIVELFEPDERAKPARSKKSHASKARR